MQRSLTASPANTAARLALAARSLPQEAMPLLQQGLRYERENPELFAALGRVAVRRGDLRALPSLQQALALDRFNTAVQTNALQEMNLLSRWLRADGRYNEARITNRTGIRLFRDYSRLANQVAQHTAWRNDRKFRLTLEARVRGRELYAFSAEMN
ncbi:hypothetical protein RE628_24515 [Paenibacillus sp. D2_2]|uniref:tetratricopeptide repeat protein n=1 Tax=Paenibacillus sp. D2_2 TaxID=3073092 RepID=UPI00281620CB|nr:hypothetical protein [Paenibacillus sp. D2_2]WMT40340.1 hypothetical protein RE628_24515 [Paenibacillus sp. D2_2]